MLGGATIALNTIELFLMAHKCTFNGSLSQQPRLFQFQADINKIKCRLSHPKWHCELMLSKFENVNSSSGTNDSGGRAAGFNTLVKPEVT